ncbi:hypothetical protein BpHYR1_038958 [Brachionus plicatilis]|uniref:Uncharacterized protein n=1 Tax=Brachionus plicatilis TaxID=10195 RepID=A0A3M7R8B4_BRAPC|nr:hypothetical protein BpHYR1_038958 [Brachionus plicatilis]
MAIHTALLMPNANNKHNFHLKGKHSEKALESQKIKASMVLRDKLLVRLELANDLASPDLHYTKILSNIKSFISHLNSEGLLTNYLVIINKILKEKRRLRISAYIFYLVFPRKLNVE